MVMAGQVYNCQIGMHICTTDEEMCAYNVAS